MKDMIGRSYPHGLCVKLVALCLKGTVKDFVLELSFVVERRLIENC
jgi:hypothetical protein